MGRGRRGPGSLLGESKPVRVEIVPWNELEEPGPRGERAGPEPGRAWRGGGPPARGLGRGRERERGRRGSTKAAASSCRRGPGPFFPGFLLPLLHLSFIPPQCGGLVAARTWKPPLPHPLRNLSGSGGFSPPLTRRLPLPWAREEREEETKRGGRLGAVPRSGVPCV